MNDPLQNGRGKTWSDCFAARLVFAALAILCAMGCNLGHMADDAIHGEPTIIAATYNIHIGKTVDTKVIDLQRIAMVILEGRPSVIGLQEVDRLTSRSGKVDELAKLEAMTGMTGVFGKSIDFQGGEYGIAILTTGEIVESRHELHPKGEEAERRSFLMVKIRHPNGAEFWVVNTHLGLNHADRKAQTQAILTAVATLEGPVLIMGDLNERPDEPVDSICHDLDAAGFVDAWVAADVKAIAPMLDPSAVRLHDGATFRSTGPDRRIDYIWVSAEKGWKPREALILESQASDHLPLFVEFTGIR